MFERQRGERGHGRLRAERGRVTEKQKSRAIGASWPQEGRETADRAERVESARRQTLLKSDKKRLRGA